MNVVLGASGAVGSRLVRRLAASGESVRALIRREAVEMPAGVERVRGDLLDPATLGPLFEGATVIYYLVHAMGAQPLGGKDLVAEDRRQAEHAFTAAVKSGRPRVVYVSGLGASADAPSAHLRGRFAVEEALEKSGLERVVFRAGILLGPGSVGFEVLLRYVRSPLLPLPAWSDLPMQPFALSDLLDALVRAGHEAAFANRTISVGSKDRLTYAELFRRAAKAMGLSPLTLDMPRQLERIGPLAVAMGGDIPYREAEALVESMVTAPFVVEDDGAAMRELGIPYRTFEEALQLALRDAVKESFAGVQ
ncbi:MAG TPA: NAD(P)H-binding protein [Planctomycetota bacterium]|nr:NAD(P)H-binding protein [Planctomycetota bacterium]